MGTYELLFILSPKMTEEEGKSTISEYKGVAEQQGLKLVSEDAWGRRRLAYPIRKSNDGVYHLFVFEGEGDSLRELDRRMKNNDQIMRHMIVRTDLETRRAKKLALKNPPKPRRKPTDRTETMAPALAPATAPAPATETTTAPASDPESPAPTPPSVASAE